MNDRHQLWISIANICFSLIIVAGGIFAYFTSEHTRTYSDNAVQAEQIANLKQTITDYSEANNRRIMDLKEYVTQRLDHIDKVLGQ